ncbi:MAG: DUF3516 domain-containing protein [Deltaproteobacteria bacterium]|nr:MAG: DUF3516 domain-containing protein [Deltaproteobacteria bacterium]
MPALAELRPPANASADEVLERFLRWVESQGFELYPAQEEAILELFAGNHVVLETPTGSGKSLVALALHFFAFGRSRVSFYTAPVKALVNEKFFALCDLFGAENVGLLTGDASINRHAPIVCCTAEILANLTLRDDSPPVDEVVMDEFHFYGDRDRGLAWQIPLLTLPRARFLLMSATLGDTRHITERLEVRTQRPVALVRGTTRPVPLLYEYRQTPIHETVQALLETGRAPIYLVNFTQRAATEMAQAMLSVDVCTKEEKSRLKEALGGEQLTTPFGKDMRRLLAHGIGLHHAGLLPRYRRLVERLAGEGLLKVVSGTDTLGVGVNIPIRTVLFSALSKYDGEKNALLSARDFHQIAGRAGRRGFDEVGYVVCQAPAHEIENRRAKERAASGRSNKRKVMTRKPPPGFVRWDEATFERLKAADPEPLQSRFEIDHGLLLSVLQGSPGDAGYRRLVELIALSHETAGQKSRHRRRARTFFRTLLQAGIVRLGPPGRRPRLEVDPDLQRDFSLHHTLSLWLVEVLPLLDREAPTYPLDVLSCVEAILESPRVVLRRQLDHKKKELLAAMKAEGVPYEERIARLEEVEIDKPLAPFIYETFNRFSEAHPWVGAENIRPKSIARDAFERAATFKEYVQLYGLKTSEGVLLRYLSQAYKTLVQNVPQELRSDGVNEIAVYLHELVRGTDASLLDEWQDLLEPARRRGIPIERREPSDAGADPRTDPAAFRAHLRNELHRIQRCIAARDWPGLREAIRNPEAWSDEALEALFAPFFEARGGLDLGPRARLAQHTTFTAEEGGRLRLQQVLCDLEGEDDYALLAWADPSAPYAPGEPVLSLVGLSG